MLSLELTNKNSFFCVDRMQNEHGLERPKAACLLLKHTFAIIFSVFPSGYSGTIEIIILLPPQLKKADRKWEKFLFSLLPTTKLNISYSWGSCCRHPSFPRKNRGKEFNWGSSHTTILSKKDNWSRCTNSIMFLKRHKMRGAATSTAFERSFPEYHHQNFIFKASASNLHSKMHKHSQCKQQPAGLKSKTTQTRKTPQNTQVGPPELPGLILFLKVISPCTPFTDV